MFLHPENLVGQLGIMPGMIIADIGSGIGYFSLPLAKSIGAAGQVYAIDIHENILKRLHNDAREQGIENITILRADAERAGDIPLRDETVDMVVIINTLFQAGNHGAMISEALRILKPGGSFIVIDWQGSLASFGPASHQIVTTDFVHTLAQGNKLIYIRDIGNTGSHHYGLVFQK